MSSQAEKYHLAMAGEYFVAGQLQRLGLSASVTYGNAKSADVVAFVDTSSRALVIEVKTSRSNRWPVGSRTPPPSDQVWVFVALPEDATSPPEFFVLTQKELHSILLPEEEAYFAKYKQKHGEDYGDKPGVIAAKRGQLEPYKNAWHTVLKRVEA